MESVNLHPVNLGHGHPTYVRPERCTICGEYKKKDQPWFLMTQNRGDDKLNIWKWNQRMAGRANVHSLCSPRHVHELVVHWMTTGCLHYPFASGPSPCPGSGSSAASGASTNDQGAPGKEAPPYQLGEIEVDRGAIARVLRENPLSLNVLLQELLVALEREVGEDIESDFEEEIRFALRSV
jgi:hypothetical protein